MNRNKTKRTAERFLHTILSLLYPPRCPVCDEILPFRKEKCCSRCYGKLPWVKNPVCFKCGKMVDRPEQEYCSDCEKQNHYFDGGAAAFTYTGEMRRSVYRMKFENRRDYLDFYAEAMVAACEKKLKLWQPERIVPVPMHPSKQRKRGYNQSELLAYRISLLTGIPIDRKVLRCVKKTSDQKKLGRRERMNNLKGTFEIRSCPEQVDRILVVDDVYTTGSTMDEISRILKKAGVGHVYFIVLCTGKGKKTVCTAENV